MGYNLCIIINNHCNLKCKYCFYVSGLHKHKNSEIDLTKIERFTRCLSKKREISQITLTGGEPFLYSRLGEMTTRLSFYCPKITICTNGTINMENDIRWIINNDIDLHISLDSPRQEYIKEHRGGYSKLMTNLNMLSKKGFKNLTLSCALTKYNIGHLEELKLFADNIGADVELNMLQSKNMKYNWTSDEIMHEYPVKNVFNDFLQERSEFYWKLLQFLLKGHKIKNCPHTKKRIVVDCDGSVYPCFHARTKIGHYDENTSDILIAQSLFAKNNYFCTASDVCCFNEI